jgi:hypothetical protein
MPWNSEDAGHHTKKANDPKRQPMWARIANSVLSIPEMKDAPSARPTQRSRKTSPSLFGPIKNRSAVFEAPPSFRFYPIKGLSPDSRYEANITELVQNRWC